MLCDALLPLPSQDAVDGWDKILGGVSAGSRLLPKYLGGQDAQVGVGGNRKEAKRNRKQPACGERG